MNVVPPETLVRRAWLSLATVPVFLFLGFAAGEATLSLLGHPSGGDVPLWASLIMDVVVLTIVCAPPAVAVVHARRARAAGSSRALAPLVIGWIVIVGLTTLTVVSELGNIL